MTAQPIIYELWSGTSANLLAGFDTKAEGEALIARALTAAADRVTV